MGLKLEFATNAESRVPVVLILDASGSMAGEPLAELNKAIRLFKSDVQKDVLAAKRVELCLIRVSQTAQVIQDFVTIDKFEPTDLVAEGETPLGAAIQKAVEVVEQRKVEYKANDISYFRPWIWIMTDGVPTDPQAVEEAIKKLHAGELEKKFMTFVVGIGNVEAEVLTKIAPPNRSPLRLSGLNFSEMFKWLSGSLKRTSQSRLDDKVKLDPTTGWGEVAT